MHSSCSCECGRALCLTSGSGLLCHLFRVDGFLAFYFQAAGERPDAVWNDLTLYGFQTDLSCAEELLVARRAMYSVGELISDLEAATYRGVEHVAIQALCPGRGHLLQLRLYQVLVSCSFNLELATDHVLQTIMEYAAAKSSKSAASPPPHK